MFCVCPQSSLPRACYPGFCPNLLADSPWLPSGCSNSHVLLSNKGTWNHRNWVRPNGQSRVGPVNAVFAGLSGATGPLVSPHQPELMVHSAGAGWGPPAASLGWIPQTQGTSEARDLRPPPCNSPCLRSLFHLFPLCLWSSIPSLPLGFREHLVIPESGPNNFLVMGKPQSSHGSPRLPPLFPLAVPHSPCSSAGSSCVLQNSHWITSVIASRCEPQKHKGAMSSSLSSLPHAWAPLPPDAPDFSGSPSPLVRVAGRWYPTPQRCTGRAKQLLAGEAQEARRRVRVPGWQEGGVPLLPKQSHPPALNSSWIERLA